MTELATPREQAHGELLGPDQLALIAGVVAVILGVIGVILSFQQVSLATGEGIVWTGVALAIGGAIAAIAIPRVQSRMKAIAILAAALAVINAFNVQSDLNQKRHDLQQIVNQVNTTP